MKRGDLVQTLFDTGAFGCSILYGVVTKAGAATYTVQWESTITNRVQQGYAGISLARDQETARAAMAKVTA